MAVVERKIAEAVVVREIVEAVERIQGIDRELTILHAERVALVQKIERNAEALLRPHKNRSLVGAEFDRILHIYALSWRLLREAGNNLSGDTHLYVEDSSVGYREALRGAISRETYAQKLISTADYFMTWGSKLMHTALDTATPFIQQVLRPVFAEIRKEHRKQRRNFCR